MNICPNGNWLLHFRIPDAKYCLQAVVINNTEISTSFDQRLRLRKHQNAYRNIVTTMNILGLVQWQVNTMNAI